MKLARNQRRILEFLATRSDEVAGIEVADALGSLARSSAYAALAALQRDGFVAARWDHTASHPRRLVRITAEGHRALARADAASRSEHRSPSSQQLSEGAS